MLVVIASSDVVAKCSSPSVSSSLIGDETRTRWRNRSAYDTADFSAALQDVEVTPHVLQEHDELPKLLTTALSLPEPAKKADDKKNGRQVR